MTDDVLNVLDRDTLMHYDIMAMIHILDCIIDVGLDRWERYMFIVII